MRQTVTLRTREDALEAAREWERRQDVYSALRDEGFPAQARFLKDTSRFKAMLCPRRAGKSSALGRWLVEPLIKYPKVSTVFAALTRDSAKKIMWRDVLKELDEKLAIGGKFNETELSYTLPNGSMLYLTGLDQGPDQMKKLLGQKPKRVGIDECGEYRQNLEEIVYRVLRPALIDYMGELALGGTPGDIPEGLFFDITRQDGQPRRKGWSVHEWTALDNPYVSGNFQLEIDQLKAENPRIEETPWFQQMMMGKWFTDTSNLVYKFDRTLNLVRELPSGYVWTYVLGVDLGFNDASAFTLYAFSPESPDLYIVESTKRAGMLINEVADQIRYFIDKYQVSYLPCDPASKQVIEELKERYHIPLVSAEKTEKDKFIEMYNADLIMGRIKAVESSTVPLQTEWASLIWDRDAARKVEHPRCKNDCADSALYGWRYCYQFLYRPKTKVIQTVEEKLDKWEQREIEKLEEQQFTPFWERDYGAA